MTTNTRTGTIVVSCGIHCEFCRNAGESAKIDG